MGLLARRLISPAPAPRPTAKTMLKTVALCAAVGLAAGDPNKPNPPPTFSVKTKEYTGDGTWTLNQTIAIDRFNRRTKMAADSAPGSDPLSLTQVKVCDVYVTAPLLLLLLLHY